MSPTGKSDSFRSCVRASEAAWAREDDLLAAGAAEPEMFSGSAVGPGPPAPSDRLRTRSIRTALPDPGALEL